MIDQPVTLPCGTRRSPSQYSIGGRLSGYFWSGISLLWLLPIGCAAAPDPATVPIPFEVAVPTPASLLNAAQQVQAKAVRLTPPADPVTITYYHLDNRCQDFVAEPLQVDKQNPIHDVVGKILLDQNFAAFDLSAYRVTVDPETGKATVELRLAPDSKRLLVSLSSCEQLSLFGSLRKTLLGNTGWAIREVAFTSQGQAIAF